MKRLSSVWEPFLGEPLFILTADQDWAPEWALRDFISRVQARSIPLHMFRTNPSPLLDSLASTGAIDQGWHPNFLPGSTQGSTTLEVIQYCQQHFPGAITARSHAMAEDSYRWRALSDAGIKADSQGVSLFQGYLLPMVHWTGIIRLPVYFEDDVFYEVADPALRLDTVLPTLFTPGLKILNFHPTFVGCNTPSRAFHEQHHRQIFGSISPPPDIPWEGRGAANVFEELMDMILSADRQFMSFHGAVSMAITQIQENDEISPPVRE